MFILIEGMPPDVMAIEASGEVTHEDYRDTLIPQAEAMIAKGPAKMIYIIGKDFKGFKLGAMWDDTVFGIKHWHDFSHVAVVADQAWLRTMITIFKPFVHGELRLFSLSELPAAKDWITQAKRTGA
ncbi:MAG TPA: STAS/SEC14 domain-containing protein [Acidisoma sp.]|uniref:STAS/SEC14 domain-containing protein n=1 Tax=Acidisoma sp. TaxID=1872115 RepID=UPI002C26AFDB|nr:STAS/SEC14 domain-containing protein [Acidisoma sp.]HTI01536.1 STAS/SEC14 domain-containing protein [Acidisoma sp.]